MSPLPMTRSTTLHFLRPQWLWALLALPLIAWLWWQRGRRDNVWRASVDAHLLPLLLEPASNVRTRGTLAAVLLAFALAVLALAGPAWRQVAQPVWQSRTPLVVALDLSSSALAADLPPSRLLQARAKLATLLRERAGGQVGLLAFADDAYHRRAADRRCRERRAVPRCALARRDADRRASPGSRHRACGRADAPGRLRSRRHPRS